jgi:hypothetical protein
MRSACTFFVFIPCLYMSSASAIGGDNAKPAQLNQLRLYIPGPELPNRVKDINELANYIKAVEKAASACVGEAEKPKATGLLIAVGIKSGKKARIWCQAVDGEVSKELLRKLEKELAKVETIEPKKSPIAFGMEMKLFGKTPKKFPEFPDVWLDAAKTIDSKLLIPPDDLFRAIWPD